VIRSRALQLGIVAGVWFVACAHQERVSESARSGGAPLLRIQVDDADEALLVQQQLKLRPIRARGSALYFARTAETEALLRRAGFEPAAADPEEGTSALV
jgi:hypothetical protein